MADQSATVNTTSGGAPKPKVTLVQNSTLLRGKDQYLGGECSSLTSKLFFIPGNAAQVLTLDPSTDELELIGPKLQGQYKWLRGVECPKTKIIYGLPCHSDSVLRIDPRTETVTMIPIPPVPNADEDEPSIIGMQWKYHGGNLSPIDGKIYAMPQRGTRVLCIDPATDTISHVGMRLDGWYKWYGGLVGCDGSLYGVPQCHRSVLRVNPGASDPAKIVTLHGDFGDGGHKWHGGGATEGGKSIFGIPCNSDQVLRIDPPDSPEGEPNVSLLGDESIVKTGRHRSDKKYKFLGAVADDNSGHVYFIPSGADRVLRVNVATNELEEVGPHIEDGGLERVHQNKWQNGFFSKVDQCVYAIPLNGDRLLRVDGTVDGEPVVETFGPNTVGVEKWEGAVIAGNGVAYSCPNNYKGYLKIEPAVLLENTGDATTLQKENGVSETIDSSAGPQSQNSQNGIQKGSNLPTSTSDASGNASDPPTNGHASPSSSHSTGAENAAPNSTDDIPDVKYQLGIPTLRSATHRVRYSANKSKGRHKDKPSIDGISGIKGEADETFVSKLPMAIRGEHRLTFNTEDIDLHQTLVDLLSDPALEGLLGFWEEGAERKMHNFRIPPQSLNHRKGGQVTEAQEALSKIINSEQFLDAFDRIVIEVVLPWLKSKLIDCGYVDDASKEMAFYYQRPPTLRLQPGPSNAVVKPHCDSIYGHQDGELNFWMPLMNNDLTGTYLWTESFPNIGDFHELKVDYGEIASFHGSYCRHYVPANRTSYTRASIDFRVGIEGLFDPEWEMIGTTAEHSRRKYFL